MAATVDLFPVAGATTRGDNTDWMYEQLPQQYVLDPENRKFMSGSIPGLCTASLRTLARAVGRA